MEKNVVMIGGGLGGLMTGALLAKEGYAVIFVTEEEAEGAREMIARFAAEPLPAIIPIPGASGANGFGMRAVRANVEKAVGVDILLGKKGEE